MRVICAWCNKVLIEGDEKLGISHGICQSCKDIVEEEAQISLLSFYEFVDKYPLHKASR